MAKQMQAWAVTNPGETLENVKLEAPEAEAGAVVLDVARCGVCHSDVHLWEGGFDFGGQQVTLAAMGIEMPLVLGHEILGTVSSVGPDAKGVEVGDTRIVYPWIGCGECARCREERDDLCEWQAALGVRRPGGFGDKVMVPDAKYLIDPGDIDLSWAATLACSGLTAYGAVQKLMPMDPNTPIVVIGAGGVGLSAVGVLSALGHRNTIIVDIEDSRLATAKSSGASATVNSRTAPNAIAAVNEAAGAPVMGVIDFVNSPQTAALAFSLPAKGGAVVQVGLFGGSFPLPLAAMAVRAIRLEGSYVGSLAELRELVALARTGKLTPPPVAEVPRSEAGATLAALRDGSVVGRVVIND